MKYMLGPFEFNGFEPRQLYLKIFAERKMVLAGVHWHLGPWVDSIPECMQGKVNVL
jgi:hypothetical protein